MRLFLILVWGIGWGMVMPFSCSAQSKLYLEIAGSAGLGSVNFEHDFHQSGDWEVGWRLGISFLPIDKNAGTVFILPAGVAGRWGKNQHKLEIGGGLAPTVQTSGGVFFSGIPWAGYRLDPEKGRLFFRATYTPIVSFLTSFQVQQWAGVSVGIKLGGAK